MSKKFFDVFPALKLDTGIHDLFEQTMVEKVTATRRKDFLRIYLRIYLRVFLRDFLREV